MSLVMLSGGRAVAGEWRMHEPGSMMVSVPESQSFV